VLRSTPIHPPDKSGVILYPSTPRYKFEAAVQQIMKLGDKEREEMISTKKKYVFAKGAPLLMNVQKENGKYGRTWKKS